MIFLLIILAALVFDAAIAFMLVAVGTPVWVGFVLLGLVMLWVSWFVVAE